MPKVVIYFVGNQITATLNTGRTNPVVATFPNTVLACRLLPQFVVGLLQEVDADSVEVVLEVNCQNAPAMGNVLMTLEQAAIHTVTNAGPVTFSQRVL